MMFCHKLFVQGNVAGWTFKQKEMETKGVAVSDSDALASTIDQTFSEIRE